MVAAQVQALQEATARLEALAAELSGAQAQLLEKDNKVGALEAELSHQQQQLLQHLQQQQQAKEMEVEAVDGESTSKLQAQLVNEQNARAEAESTLALATTELTQARADVRQAEEKVEESRRAMEEAQEAARKEHERVDNELAVREAEVATLKEQLRTLSRDMKVGQESLSQTETAAQGNEQTLVSLRKKLSQVQTQLDLAQSMVDKHEARIKELETENNRVIRVAEDDVKKIRAELERATKGQAQASARGQEMQGWQKAHQALTKKVATLKAEKEEAEGRANAAADAADGLEKEVEELRMLVGDGKKQGNAAAEMEELRRELDAARANENEVRQEASQQQVRQKRLQKEVEQLREECSRARDELEGVKAELAAALAAVAAAADQDKGEAAVAAAMGEVKTLRAQLAVEREDEAARLAGLKEALSVATARARELEGELQRVQERLEAVEGEVEGAKVMAGKAEGSRSELLKELNTLFEAKFEAESRVAVLEDEMDKLKKQVVERETEVSRGAEEAAAAEVEELRAALAHKEAEGYRTKRELAELKEAAEAAEEAMGAQQTEVTRLQAESRAKDERIKKLDAVKLTTDQVEKLRKIKAEHVQFSAANKTLRQELEALRQQQQARAAASSSSAAQALEAQSQTIAELMVTRDGLQEKLQGSMAACRKFELERLSVREALQELPPFENEEEGGREGLGFEGEVPEDLGVAVGVVLEKMRVRLCERERASGDRALLLREVETLAAEKEALKARLEDLEAGVDGAQEVEGELREKYAGACLKIKGLEEEMERVRGQVREGAMDRQVAAEEAGRNIRFLEKENLELMMEIKKVKEQASRLQAELGGGGGGGGGRGGGALRPIHGQHPNVGAAASASAEEMMGISKVVKPYSSSSSSSSTLPPSVPVGEKENVMNAMVVGENMLRAKEDETAPPFRSMDDDETVAAANQQQCKQS